jgi:hypothetical protein
MFFRNSSTPRLSFGRPPFSLAGGAVASPKPALLRGEGEGNKRELCCFNTCTTVEGVPFFGSLIPFCVLRPVLRIRDTGAIEERFLSAQADPFAGSEWEEKVGPLRSK